MAASNSSGRVMGKMIMSEEEVRLVPGHVDEHLRAENVQARNMSHDMFLAVESKLRRQRLPRILHGSHDARVLAVLIVLILVDGAIARIALRPDEKKQILPCRVLMNLVYKLVRR